MFCFSHLPYKTLALLTNEAPKVSGNVGPFDLWVAAHSNSLLSFHQDLHQRCVPLCHVAPLTAYPTGSVSTPAWTPLQQLWPLFLAHWSEDWQGGGWIGWVCKTLMNVICAFSLTQLGQLHWAEIPHSIVLLLRKQNRLYLALGIFCVGLFRREFAKQMDWLFTVSPLVQGKSYYFWRLLAPGWACFPSRRPLVFWSVCWLSGLFLFLTYLYAHCMHTNHS